MDRSGKPSRAVIEQGAPQLLASRSCKAVFPALVIAAGVSCAEPIETEPAPDVFLADLTLGDTAQVGVPKNVTNHSGYDNQPFFTHDGQSILYTCETEGQTDIHRFDIAGGATERVTRTAESEYSPTPMAGGSAFSTIRVEQDSTQRLWAFNLDGSGARLLLPDVAPVGYHAWVDSTSVALFVLGSPPTLQMTTLTSGTTTVEADNIGRSLHKVPDQRAVSYVRKISDSEWWIIVFDPAAHEHTRLVQTLPGREDYAWTPDRSLLMADSTTLYQWKRGWDDWSPIAELASHGLGPVTRLAVSPAGDRIALVSDVY